MRVETKKLDYTPGPWRFVKTNGSPTTGAYLIAGEGPGYLAEVRDCGSGCVFANGRLIAAAPDMHAALKMAVDLLDTICPMEGDVLRRCRAVLDRVGGYS